MANVARIAQKRAKKLAASDSKLVTQYHLKKVESRLQEEIERLHLRDNSQLKQIGDVAAQRTTREQVRRIIKNEFIKEFEQLEKLRDDVVKVLEYMMSRDLISREDMNKIL